MNNIVKEYLRQHGYDSCVDENQEARVNEWLEVFKGPTKIYRQNIQW